MISPAARVFVLLLMLVLSSPSLALVILQYHHISDNTPSATSISPALFEAHLRFLEQNDFRVIDVSELKGLLEGKDDLPDDAVIITFDDGYRSIYNNAFPLLKKRGWPFTVFINSKPHDEKNSSFMSWEQLKEMSKHKATIANHTDSHLHMIRRLQNEDSGDWLERIETEIDLAESRIEKEIGIKPEFFAWPYGEYNLELQNLLNKKGYLAFGQQSGPVSKDSHPQALPRFTFGGEYGDISDFSTKVFSLPLPIDSIETESPGYGRFLDPELPPGVSIPTLHIDTPLAAHIKNIQCFASGQGKINTSVGPSTIVASASRELRAGRSRYNCTADAGNGRFYWYSQMFIKREKDGSWYKEP